MKEQRQREVSVSLARTGREAPSSPLRLKTQAQGDQGTCWVRSAVMAEAGPGPVVLQAPLGSAGISQGGHNMSSRVEMLFCDCNTF